MTDLRDLWNTLECVDLSALRRNLAKWPIGGDLNDLEPGRWSLMLASLASGTNLRKRTAGNGPGTGENVRCACRDAIE